VKISSEGLADFFKREPAIFLAINVAFPFLAVLFLQISRDVTFRWASVLTFSALILVANIYRIRHGESLKGLYIVISVLNVLSFPLAGGMSFSTTLDTWPLMIKSILYYLN